MKSSQFIATLLVLASSMIGSLAQARQFYWTGFGTVYYNEGSYNPVADCQSDAYYRAEQGVRESCFRDYRVQWETCQSAPVVNVQYLNVTENYNGVSCTVRVYIAVP